MTDIFSVEVGDRFAVTGQVGAAMSETERQVDEKFGVQVDWDQGSPAEARRGVITYRNGKSVAFTKLCVDRVGVLVEGLLSSGELRRLGVRICYQAKGDDRQFDNFGELMEAYQPY